MPLQDAAQDRCRYVTVTETGVAPNIMQRAIVHLRSRESGFVRQLTDLAAYFAETAAVERGG